MKRRLYGFFCAFLGFCALSLSLAAAPLPVEGAAPDWGAAQIEASRRIEPAKGVLPDRPLPVYAGVDMLNLVFVAEGGGDHVSIIDGDKLEAVHRFAIDHRLEAGPEFSPDGRYAYLGSSDGWISKYDLWNLTVVAEIRAGLGPTKLAVSADGAVLAVANASPRTLVLLDSELGLQKVLALRDQDGAHSSRVSALADLASRRAFVVAMQDMAELWEVSYDAQAAPIYEGYVHDYRMREGIAKPGYLNPRRTPLEAVFEGFLRVSSATVLLSSPRGGGQVINLDIRRKIADLHWPGAASLAAGLVWTLQGRTDMAVPLPETGAIAVFDTMDWKPVKTVTAPGPGLFMASHPNTPALWLGAGAGPASDRLRIFDKRTLEPIAELDPPVAKGLTHVEFTRDGRYALASLSEPKSEGGALIVIDAATFKEVKRLPMERPTTQTHIGRKLGRSH